MQRKLKITVDTPLSALFRENHHEELRTIIESWRPYMIGGDACADALEMCYLGFDFTRIPLGHIYRDLAVLINHDGLIPTISLLASYLTIHSNLSVNKNTVYRQLMRYRKLYR